MATIPYPTRGLLQWDDDLELYILDRIPLEGHGSPEGVVLAREGRIYIDVDGGIHPQWVKAAGGTSTIGWVATS